MSWKTMIEEFKSYRVGLHEEILAYIMNDMPFDQFDKRSKEQYITETTNELMQIQRYELLWREFDQKYPEE